VRHRGAGFCDGGIFWPTGDARSRTFYDASASRGI